MDTNPATKPLTHTLSSLQSELGLEPNTNHHQRDFIQQLTGAGAESHDLVIRVLQRQGSWSPAEVKKEGLEEPESSGTLQERNPQTTDRTQVGSQRSESLDGSDLGPLHRTCGWVPWSSCGTSKSGIGVCLWLFCLPLGSFFSYWAASSSPDIRVRV